MELPWLSNPPLLCSLEWDTPGQPSSAISTLPLELYSVVMTPTSPSLSLWPSLLLATQEFHLHFRAALGNQGIPLAQQGRVRTGAANSQDTRFPFAKLFPRNDLRP